MATRRRPANDCRMLRWLILRKLNGEMVDIEMVDTEIGGIEMVDVEMVDI